MKKRVLTVLFVIVVIVAAVVAGILLGNKKSETVNATTEKVSENEIVHIDELKDKVREAAGKETGACFFYDYDGDKTKEAFIIIGDIEKDEANEIWYASDSEVKKVLSTDYSYIYYADALEVDGNQRLFVAEYGGGGSASLSKLFYVKDGKLCEDGGTYSGLSQYEGNDFTVINHGFDNSEDKKSGILTGHTYRQYFLKWNGEKFEEYKGKNISADELQKYKNGKQILNEISDLGYTVDEIYIRRNNSIVNINIHKEDDNSIYYENVNLEVENNELNPFKPEKFKKNIVDKTSFGGRYAEALLD